MRKRPLQLILTILGVFFLASVLDAQDKEITFYEQKQQSLQEQKKGLMGEREKLQAEGNALAEKIAELKKQLSHEKSFIKEYQLKENLKESNRLSQKIETMDRQLRELEKESAGVKEKLASLYEIKVGELIKSLEKEKDIRKKDQMLKEVFTLRQKKSNLLALHPSDVGSITSLPNIVVRAEDTPEEIREKINLIKDYQDKLSNQIRALDKQIKSYTAEKKTREKLAEFISESDLTLGDASLGGSAKRGGVVAEDSRRAEDNLQKQAREVSKGEVQDPSRRSLDDEIKRLENERRILQEQRKTLTEQLNEMNGFLRSYEKKDR